MPINSQCRFITVLEPWRLSVWLLARILNLSVQASRSSFTPTTERKVIMWWKSFLYMYLWALSLTFRRIVHVHTVPHVSEVAKEPRSEVQGQRVDIPLNKSFFTVSAWHQTSFLWLTGLMCLKVLSYLELYKREQQGLYGKDCVLWMTDSGCVMAVPCTTSCVLYYASLALQISGQLKDCLRQTSVSQSLLA